MTDHLGPLTCPVCAPHAMERYFIRGIALDQCSSCGGQWFDRGELEQVARSVPSVAVPLGRPDADSIRLSTHMCRRPCPRCQVSLAALPVTGLGGVFATVCPGCEGIWQSREFKAAVRRARQGPDPYLGMDGPTSWGDWCFQFFLGLPVEFNVRPRTRPAVTQVLVLVNLIVFAILACLKLRAQLHEGLEAGGLIFSVVNSLAASPGAIRAGHQLWTPLTCQFVHLEFVHVAINVYFLYILGDNVEDVLGKARFLAFYLGTGALGILTQVAMTPAPYVPVPVDCMSSGLEWVVAWIAHPPIIGASAGVSGLLAAYALLFHRAKLSVMFLVIQRKIGIGPVAVVWFLLQIALGWAQVGRVAYWSHLGGFLAGLLIILPWRSALTASHPVLSR